jgi:hypothetical protein
MQTLPITLPAGVVKNESPLSATGRYIACEGVRFRNKKPEKIGGNTALAPSIQALVGEPSALFTWNDLTERQLLAGATEQRLASYSSNDLTNTDITPEAASLTSANPLTTTVGSSIVSVHYPSHGGALEQAVVISGSAAVGGVTPNGTFTLTTLVDADHFTVDIGTTAASSTTGGGATVRVALLLAPGTKDPSSGYGWGVGTWGTGTWGTPRTTGSVQFLPRSWSLDSFGKLLLAVPSLGTLYSWDPTVIPAPRAAAVVGAPAIMQAMFVTKERIVTCLGTDSALTGKIDPMEVWWGGQGTINDFDITAQVSTAGGSPSRVRRLQGGTHLVAGVGLGNNVSLIWSDTTLFSAQYTGSQFVFNTRAVADNCGLLGPKAFCTAGGRAFWAAPSSLKMYDGSVKDIPNSEDVIQWINDQVRPYYTVKTICYFNQQFQEVWFEFVVDNNTVPTLAVFVNINDWSWSTTTQPRTAATAWSGGLSNPLLAAADGNIYEHETTKDDHGGVLGEDTLTGTFGAGDGLVDFALSGRQISGKLACAELNSDFRLGTPSVLTTTAGART